MTHHDSEASDLADRLMPAMFRILRRLKRDAPPLTLKPIELMVLFTVRHAPGIGMAELAAREGISSPTMSAHVKRLESTGMLTREIDAVDRRRVTLGLTPLALETLESTEQRGNGVMAACIASLTDEDRAILARAIGPLERLAGDAPCVKEVS